MPSAESHFPVVVQRYFAGADRTCIKTTALPIRIGTTGSRPCVDVTMTLKPWTLRIDVSVGGLTGVGFGLGSDVLFAISSHGRGVSDCITGDRVARDNVDRSQST